MSCSEKLLEIQVVAEPGFLCMPDLSYKAWDLDETYGGRYWTQIMRVHERIFAIEACEEN